jgi:hypothetical protein
MSFDMCPVVVIKQNGKIGKFYNETEIRTFKQTDFVNYTHIIVTICDIWRIRKWQQKRDLMSDQSKGKS